ncbi:prepilin-type N-terminal cleavage/methylation domain-containing protein [Candidatus Saccharibacteria bacterium]|nr:prepilin-type N-terminal cleavage/methylation domain-containing protein [Candidatus Saccharibacteria bacterium]
MINISITGKTTKRTGFTIVELLIVIVVIGILAAITIVAFNGIQHRGRDAQRKSDIANITKALELYYIDNGQFPAAGGSTAINSSWSTTADASWQNFRTAIATYMKSVPTDPSNTSGVSASGGSGYTYDYFQFQNSAYCGSTAGQGYLLIYRLAASSQQNNLIGNCTGTPVGPYAASNYRVVK